jgi:hypothetical protein
LPKTPLLFGLGNGLPEAPVQMPQYQQQHEFTILPASSSAPSSSSSTSIAALKSNEEKICEKNGQWGRQNPNKSKAKRGGTKGKMKAATIKDEMKGECCGHGPVVHNREDEEEEEEDEEEENEDMLEEHSQQHQQHHQQSSTMNYYRNGGNNNSGMNGS